MTQNQSKTTRSANSTRQRAGTDNRVRSTSSAVASGVLRPSTTLTNASRRKREQQNENLQIAITELLNHFSHRNLDALARAIKMTL